jgi:hypothetical protein
MRLRLALGGLLGSIAVAAVAVTIAIAAPTAASNRRAARHDVPRLLSRLRVPPGAKAVGSDPSAHRRLGWAWSFPGTPALVDVHQFWRVPSNPVGIAAWFRQHAPPGSSVGGYGGTSGRGFEVDMVQFGFAPTPGVLSSRGIVVAVTVARGGGTAIRADAQDVWFVPRPNSERVPAGTRLIDVTVQRMNPASTSKQTVTDAGLVRKIVRLINARPPAQPGAESCPADIGPAITLDFLARRGASPIATATADGSGCGGVSFALNGKQEPALAGGWQLVRELEKLLGLKG